MYFSKLQPCGRDLEITSGINIYCTCGALTLTVVAAVAVLRILCNCFVNCFVKADDIHRAGVHALSAANAFGLINRLDRHDLFLLHMVILQDITLFVRLVQIALPFLRHIDRRQIHTGNLVLLYDDPF